MTHYNTLIKNGLIVDGTGGPGFRGEVAINGDTIAAMGTTVPGTADRVIDARGAMVCPGLIDPHVHEETVVLYDGDFELFLREGVTTTINGNCGHSVTPGDSRGVFEYYYKNGLITAEALEKFTREQPVWTDFTGYVDLVRKIGININMGFLLGHGTIRWAAMGGSEERPPTPTEEEEILGAITGAHILHPLRAVAL